MRQVLQLNESACPASGAVGSVKLKHATGAAISADRVCHGLILFDRAFCQLLAKKQGFSQVWRSILEHDGNFLLTERFDLHAVLCKPFFHLSNGIRILYTFFRRLGKRAENVCCDQVPNAYKFIPGAEEILLPEEAQGFHAVIAVDCADKGRLGSAEGIFDRAGVTANIDHHGTNTMYADNNMMEETAACAELIYRLGRALGAEIDAETANCLFAALVTDTGSFAYSNVTRDTMAIAGELIALGADNSLINRLVYHNEPAGKVKMHAYALERLHLYSEGRIATAMLTESEMDPFGPEAYTEGIVEKLRDIDTVEIAAFLRQKGEDVKVSLRAKKYADVARVAASKKGGGHPRAAGYTEYGVTVAEAEKIAVQLAEEELQACWKE